MTPGVPKIMDDVRIVPLCEWGKDHWSLLGYIETRCVDHGGILDHQHLRCNPRRHPGLALPQHVQEGDTYEHPSRIRGGALVPGHDDWDCFYDIEAGGLILDIGTGIYPRAKLTEAGLALCAKLRAHKAAGGMFATFEPGAPA